MNVLSVLRAVCAVAVVCDARAFDLVREGEARAVIVTPENPLPVVEYAAREFQDHVKKSSGVALEIVSEDSVPNDSRAKIFIGSGKAATEAALHTEGLANNGFWVASTENALFLLGKDGPGNPPKDDAAPLGTLFAVYQWLDSQLGVRWLWPGETGTFVPKKSEITEPGSRRDSHTPALLHSRLRYANGHVFGHWKDVLSPEEWDKFVNDTATWLRRHRFARNTSLEYGHGYTKYWKRFGAEHPEWFAQQPGGKRGPIDNATELVQLCVSNPGLQDQILKDWQTQRNTRPTLPWINGIENDRRREDPPCHCPKCRSWDVSSQPAGEGGSLFFVDSKTPGQPALEDRRLSDRYARFWMELLARGKKIDPDATVFGYAYADYSEPPLQTKLNEDVIVGIVPPFTYPVPERDRKRFEKLWDGWAATGCRMVLRPNYTLSGAALPYLYPRQFAADFNHAAEHGLVATDFDSLTSMWGTQGPNLYVIGRLNEDPTRNVEAILDEYYGTFGKAGPFVRDYFDHWEKITSERVTPEFGKNIPDFMWTGLYLNANQIYRTEDLAHAHNLLTQAAAAVAPDSDEAARVAFLQKGLKHTRLSLAAVAAFQNSKAAPDDAERKTEMIRKIAELDAFRATIVSDHVVDLVFLNFLEERAGFGRKQLKMQAGKEIAAELPLFWRFQWDPEKVGESKGWHQSGFDDAGWLQARTDRAWTAQPVGRDWKEEHGTPFAGSAWYRTTFTVPEKFADRKLFLSFGAMDEGGEVWVNGKPVASRKFDPAQTPDLWKEAFLVDIAAAANPRETNTIAVRVDKNHGGAGGIWKRVSVLAE
ncbi:MAG: DUF4838 domain-containing protein [Chthoniobacterales bacterium]|nr:DUF4838 domain-containing protein [Chthoniobacterales bacterium]